MCLTLRKKITRVKQVIKTYDNVVKGRYISVLTPYFIYKTVKNADGSTTEFPVQKLRRTRQTQYFFKRVPKKVTLETVTRRDMSKTPYPVEAGKTKRLFKTMNVSVDSLGNLKLSAPFRDGCVYDAYGTNIAKNKGAGADSYGFHCFVDKSEAQRSAWGHGGKNTIVVEIHAQDFLRSGTWNDCKGETYKRFHIPAFSQREIAAKVKKLKLR